MNCGGQTSSYILVFKLKKYILSWLGKTKGVELKKRWFMEIASQEEIMGSCTLKPIHEFNMDNHQ